MERAEPLASGCPGASAAALAPRRTIPSAAGGDVRWYRATEDRDRDASARWCATVGAPVVHLRPSRTFPPWTPDEGLEVVVWNTFLGGGDIERFLDRELGLECEPGASGLRVGSRPFVLMLQEAWRRSESLPLVDDSPEVPWMMGPSGDVPAEADIVRIAERCGLALVYVPSARNGPDTGPRPREDKGNAILSTLPLTDPVALDLPLEAGRKVAVGATVAAPDGAWVRMVAVHLDVASTFVRTLLTGNQTRARQTAGLIEGLEQAEADGPPVRGTVVGSDLNTWAANETALRLMRRAFPQSPEWDQFGTRGTYPADHIHLRHDPGVPLRLTDYRRIENSYGSDHHGRRATLWQGNGVGR